MSAYDISGDDVRAIGIGVAEEIGEGDGLEGEGVSVGLFMEFDHYRRISGPVLVLAIDALFCRQMIVSSERETCLRCDFEYAV